MLVKEILSMSIRLPGNLHKKGASLDQVGKFPLHKRINREGR